MGGDAFAGFGGVRGGGATTATGFASLADTIGLTDAAGASALAAGALSVGATSAGAAVTAGTIGDADALAVGVVVVTSLAPAFGFPLK